MVETIETQEIKDKIITLLSEKRYKHSLGVAETAVEIGRNIGLAEEELKKLEIAGLLHDIAKTYSTEKQYEIILENGIELTQNDLEAPSIFHAIAGRIIAEKDFGITDETILNAISRHTTGGIEMSTFDKILYASDYLEPNRGFEIRDELLAKIKFDFENGVFDVVASKLSWVVTKHKYIHKNTIDFYNVQLRLVK